MIECVRAIASLKHVFRHAARQQQKTRGEQDLTAANCDHFDDMMTALIMMQSMCTLQKESLHTPVPQSLHPPDAHRTVKHIQMTAATSNTSSSAGLAARSLGRSYASVPRAAAAPESVVDKSTERSLAAQLQQQKASCIELQKQLNTTRQQLREASTATRSLERRTSEKDLLSDQLTDLKAAKSAAEEQNEGMAADMSKQQADLAQLQQEYHVAQSQLLSCEQELEQEREKVRGMSVRLEQIDNEKNGTITELRDALLRSERKIAEANRVKLDTQDTLSTIQSRILYLEAKERELMTQLKREATRFEAERQQLRQQVLQAQSGSQDNARHALQNLDDLDAVLKAQTTDIEQLRAEKFELVHKIADVRTFAERQKREYGTDAWCTMESIRWHPLGESLMYSLLGCRVCAESVAGKDVTSDGTQRAAGKGAPATHRDHYWQLGRRCSDFGHQTAAGEPHQPKDHAGG